MLPHTHFLFALMIGLVSARYGLISNFQAFIIPFLTVIIDLDHLFSFHKHHKRWNLRDCWNTAIRTHEHMRTFIHHHNGALIISIIIVIILFFSRPWAFVLMLAYFSHLFLDQFHVHKERFRKHRIKEVFGISIPISYSEIALDFISFVIVLFLLIKPA